MKYRLTPALAVTDDCSMPFGLDEPGYDIKFGRITQRITDLHPWNEPLEVEAESVEQALEVLFREGNIGEQGWAARYREGRQRSISVGDVAIVESPEGISTWQCLSLGWGKVSIGQTHQRLREAPWSFEVIDAAIERAQERR